MAFKPINGILSRVDDQFPDISDISYKAQLLEDLSNTDAIDLTNTNALKSGACYILEYDNENITVVSNNVTIASAPNFTVAVGDVIAQGTKCVKITAVTSQTEVTVEDGSVLSNASATISQAVHSVDINSYGSAGDKTRTIDVDSDNIASALVQYIDNTAEATGTAPHVAFTASSDGFTNSSDIQEKPELSDEQINSVTFSPASTDLRVRFFSNVTTGEGNVKLTSYKVAYHN